MATCRSCGTTIFWYKNVLSGKAAPIDAEPVWGGNIALLADGFYCVLPADERAGRTDLYKSHFATCPNSKKHRKPQ
jgi:hypothetical protein